MDALLAMKPRRLSPAALPNAPLDFAYPLRVRGGSAEGAPILGEVGEGAGVVLFRVVRLVLDWARRPVPDGCPWDSAAFDDLADHIHEVPVAEELRQALGCTVAELRNWHAANPQIVSDSCSSVQEWACRAAAPQTAIAYGVAAALGNPGNPRTAWIVGKLLRDAGEWREGDMWLRRAEAVARWIGDWNTQVLALNSRGILHHFRGAPMDAERFLTQALRLARRRGLRERESEVTHDLFIVLMARGDYPRAEELAGRALELYGAEHARLPYLAHDTAQVWLHSERYALALPVLHAMPPLLLPHERIRVLASITIAAGAMRDSHTFDDAWTEASDIVATSTPEIRRTLPTVLLDLGRGAANMERWDQAGDALGWAKQAAEEGGDPDAVARAERLLQAVHQRTTTAIPRRLTTRSAADLSRALVASLSG
jgi:tetratricopeptide (TPR) repeat protein